MRLAFAARAAVAAALVGAAPPLAAQSTPLDVGSFTLLLDGQRAGREQFSLSAVTSPDGGTLELRAESAIGERRGAVRIETDSAGTPVRYAVEERDGATVALRLGGQRLRGRFATLARSRVGEAAREYLLAPGAIVLEEEGVHQYAMLVRGRRGRPGESVRVPILTPVRNRQGEVVVTLEAVDDAVVIAASRRPAWRWRIAVADGDVRTLWSDPDGRILRLVIPARKFEALRDDVPR